MPVHIIYYTGKNKNAKDWISKKKKKKQEPYTTRCLSPLLACLCLLELTKSRFWAILKK